MMVDLSDPELAAAALMAFRDRDKSEPELEEAGAMLVAESLKALLELRQMLKSRG